jgi:aryl carrier-like protein
LYGPTEAAIEVTAWTGEAEAGASVPIGRPMANVQIYILDRHGAPTPVGVPGELHIGGVQVARGYLRRPALTAERFVVDRFGRVPGRRSYRTGDVARWRADGMIEFLGRTDFQVKIRGQRIELEEIEVHLRRHAAVQRAVVTVREVAGDTRLVAYYTGRDDAEDLPSDAAALRAYLAATLPDHMVPAAYVRLAALPLMTSGKLDRRALPVPDDTAYVTRAYEAPVGAIETTVAAIWAGVLRRERIGRHDDFFALGGHSLLAMRVITRLREAGWHLDVRALFATPTIAELAPAMRPVRDRLTTPPNLIPDFGAATRVASATDLRI